MRHWSGLRPMNRFAATTVLGTFDRACALASCPTTTEPPARNATVDGVSGSPWRLGSTMGTPSRRMAIAELVVPRSIPTSRPSAERPSDSSSMTTV
eukprot:scaffold8264_cov109-Isochrysis_galbana.AAC.13